METTEITRGGSMLYSVCTTKSMLPGLTSLPREITLSIFQHLSATDLCHVALCSSWLRCATNRDLLWRPLCQRNGWERYGTVADISKEIPYEPSLQQTGAVSRGYKKVSFPMNGIVEDGNQFGLEGTCKWKEVYMKARHLDNNWDSRRFNESSYDFEYVGHFPESDDGHHWGVIGEGDYVVNCTECNFRPMLKVWNVKRGTFDNISAGRELEPGRCCDALVNLKLKNGIIVACCYDDTIRTFSVRSGERLQVIQGRKGCGLGRIFFDGEMIVSHPRSATSINVWNAENGVLLHVLGSAPPNSPRRCPGIEDLDYRDKLVAAAYSDNCLRLWDVRSGTCVHILRFCRALGDGLAQCKLGNGVVVCSAEASWFSLWSTESGECIKTVSLTDSFVLENFYFVCDILIVSLYNRDTDYNNYNAYNQHGDFLTELDGEFTGRIVPHGNKCIIERNESNGSESKLYKASEDGLHLLYKVSHEPSRAQRLTALWMDDTKIIFREDVDDCIERYVIHHYW